MSSIAFGRKITLCASNLTASGYACTTASVGAYATLAISAFATRSNVTAALFDVGAAALVLLFTGIHNAWDAVTYQVFVKKREHNIEKGE